MFLPCQFQTGIAGQYDLHCQIVLQTQGLSCFAAPMLADFCVGMLKLALLQCVHRLCRDCSGHGFSK
jgi:hypothetical protein